MDSKITIAGDKAHISIYGDLNIEDISSLNEAMIKPLEAGIIHFCFDMTNLRYMDSSGLGALIALNKKVADRGGSVAISGLNDCLRQLFELTRLTRVFKVLP